jgi:hypothetical protein
MAELLNDEPLESSAFLFLTMSAKGAFSKKRLSLLRQESEEYS